MPLSTYPVHTPNEGVVRGSAKSLAEIKLDNVLYSSLNPSRQMFHCREQSGWTSMIYLWGVHADHPDHLHVIHVDRDVLQNEVLLHLSRDGQALPGW